MLEGKKTLIGVGITLVASICTLFGINIGEVVDLETLNNAIVAIVGAGISVYGYLKTKRGANTQDEQKG